MRNDEQRGAHPFGHNSGDRPKDLDQYTDPGPDFGWKLDPKLLRLPDNVSPVDLRAFEKAIQQQGDERVRRFAIENARIAPLATLTPSERNLLGVICHYASMRTKTGDPRCTLKTAGELAIIAGIVDVKNAYKYFKPLVDKGVVRELRYRVNGDNQVRFTPIVDVGHRTGLAVRTVEAQARETYNAMCQAIRTEGAERKRKSRERKASGGSSNPDVTAKNDVTDVTANFDVTDHVTANFDVMSQQISGEELLHFASTRSDGTKSGARPPEAESGEQQSQQHESAVKEDPPTPRATIPTADDLVLDAAATQSSAGWCLPGHLLDGLMRYAEKHTQLGSRKPGRGGLVTQLAAWAKMTPGLGPAFEVVAARLIEGIDSPDATKIGSLPDYLRTGALKELAKHSNAVAETAALARPARPKASQDTFQDWERVATFGFGQHFTGRDAKDVMAAVPGLDLEAVRRTARELTGQWGANSKKTVQDMVNELIRRFKEPAGPVEPDVPKPKLKTARQEYEERQANMGRKV